ncbi:MAG: hypothetical protein ACE5E4_10785 [Candidatus Binatia bacterium]
MALVSIFVPLGALAQCGDLNDDGTVSAADALSTMRAAVEARECYRYLCDANDDGVVTTADSLILLRAAVGMSAVLGCPFEPDPPDQDDGRVFITNDETSFLGRVSVVDEVVVVDPDPSTPAYVYQAMSAGGGTADFNLNLVAKVDTVRSGTDELQATSIYKGEKKNHFIVSYAMRGAPYLGAIEYYDVGDPKKPKLKSQALFVNSDVHSLVAVDHKVYLAEASGDASLPYPAVLEIIKFKKKKFVLEDSVSVPLTSFAATSSAVGNGVVYVTTGNTGGLFAVDLDTREVMASVDLDDVRWVEIAGDKVVVLQGMPGRLSVYSAGSLDLQGSWPFSGADVPEAKTSMTVVGGKAFIAAGTAGLQVHSIETGTLLGSLPVPTVAGLDPSVVVTNSVAVKDDLIFVSNGEAGVYVARASTKPSHTGSEDPVDLVLLGKLRFDALQSVNHIAFKDKHLVVAAGLGGLKVVKVDFSDSNDE